MCELCSDDEREREAHRIVLRHQAKVVRELARMLDGFASGEIRPHTKDALRLGEAAKDAIKICAECL